jgi:hypothetical protein
MEQASQWVHLGRKCPRNWPNPLKESEDPTQDHFPGLDTGRLYRTQACKILSYRRKCIEIVEEMAVQTPRISIKHKIPIICDAKTTFAPGGNTRVKYFNVPGPSNC